MKGIGAYNEYKKDTTFFMFNDNDSLCDCNNIYQR